MVPVGMLSSLIFVLLGAAITLRGNHGGELATPVRRLGNAIRYLVVLKGNGVRTQYLFGAMVRSHEQMVTAAFPYGQFHTRAGGAKLAPVVPLENQKEMNREKA